MNTGVRRETASGYLKEAGIAVRPPGGWGRASPAKPANVVITDPVLSKPAIQVITDSAAAELVPSTVAGPSCAKPANEVITDFGAELAAAAPSAAEPKPGRCPSASACAPYRDAIEVGLAKGRNAMGIWQDLVDFCGFTGGYPRGQPCYCPVRQLAEDVLAARESGYSLELKILTK